MLEISAVIAVVMGLAELLKKIGLNAKYVPIANLIFGIVGGLVYVNPADPKMGLFNGLIIGLTASGLYSSVKNTIEGIKTQQ